MSRVALGLRVALIVALCASSPSAQVKLGIDMAAATLEHQFGKTYDFSSLEKWSRTSATVTSSGKSGIPPELPRTGVCPLW